MKTDNDYFSFLKKMNTYVYKLYNLTNKQIEMINRKQKNVS